MKRFAFWTLMMLAVASVLPAAALAAENASDESSTWLAQADKTEEEFTSVAKSDTTVSESGWQKPIPLTFSIDYTLVSDYIFRGINFSDPRISRGDANNEGNRWPNQQLTTGVEADLGEFGRVGGSVWFEWYCGQEAYTPEDNNKTLQEIDYTVYYGYTIDPIGLDVEVGFIWYMFPRVASGDGASTQEIYTILSWDDSILWRALGMKVDEPILNPYLSINWDLDLAAGSSFYEFGVSHDFALADYGCSDMPILKDTTVGLSWAMAWDYHWLNKMTLDPSASAGNEGRGYASNTSHLDYLNYGLSVTVDLKSVFDIPDQYCGDLYLTGFMNYSQAIARHFLDDQLYGGMSVGYSW